MKKLYALITLALLCACATPEQIEAQRQLQEQQDIQTCMSYGLKPKSEAFGICRMELDLARQQRYESFRGGYGSYFHSRQPAIGGGIGLGF